MQNKLSKKNNIILKTHQLTKHFGGVKAVNDCSFEIEQGKITALIGPNGAGKSTVFNLISGILKPDSGNIFFEGKDISGMSIEDISNLGMSRVFQQSRLFKNLTVRENLLLAIDNKDMGFWKNVFGINKYGKDKEKKVKNILKMVGAEKFSDQLASDLSFGQKRLTEIARAILNPHKLLILDEPVGGVTPSLKKEIKKILEILREKGETIIIIEHDMNFVFDLVDEIVVLDIGTVIAKGKPKEIKNNKKVLEAYLGQ